MRINKIDRRLTMGERTTRLREILQQSGEASVSEIAAKLGVSEMTLRRDLDRLERAGHIRRTHGGAVPTERLGFEFDFAARRQANHAAKLVIATEALKLIKPGNVILLDAGTTTLELAVLLRDRTNLVVLTPSLAVASTLQYSEGVQTILLGGVLRRGSPDLTGEVTEAVLGMFAVDIAFQGADGIALDGTLYTADLRVARVDEKIRMRAARTYILADSSKIGRTALACHGTLQEMAGWITDKGIKPEHVNALKAFRKKMMIV